MQQDDFLNLLSQQEGTNLEFKRKFHNIFDENQTRQKHQTDELIRDILSLANNNTATAGEDAYLIFGVEEKTEPGIPHEIIGLEGEIPPVTRIIDLVNSVCNPPIGKITSQVFEINTKKVLLITIHADPYLHETTRRLTTDYNKYYTEYSVFIRHGQKIQNASTKERAALQEIRRARMSDRKTVQPEYLGAALGSIIGGSLAVRLVEKTMPDTKYAREAGGALGVGIFGIFGWELGKSSKAVPEIVTNWSIYSKKQKLFVAFLGSLVMGSVMIMFRGGRKKK